MSLRLALTLLTVLTPVGAFAEITFPQPQEFKGRLRAESATPGQPVHPGSAVRFSASGLTPGQSLILQRGTGVLNTAPAIADDKGQAAVSFTLPADAATGLHPVIAILEDPAMVTTIDLKVSQKLNYLGEANWAVQAASPGKGLYQSAYSAASKALFVASADYFTGQSELLKLDPQSLEVLARVTPADYPEDQKPPRKPGKEGTKLAPAGVYGLGLDEANGRIWVTNTADNTIAVYDQKDLSLVTQLPPGAVYHARDVLIDPASKQAFVSSSASPNVYVFDLDSFAQKAVITIATAARGEDFAVMSLAADPARGEVYVVSRTSNELAVLDAANHSVKKFFALPGAKNASGVAVDPAMGRLYVAAQDSDNVLVLDHESGAVVQNITVGAGPLNVLFDATNQLVWAASRGAGSISAIDQDGKLVAHLDGGSYTNHLSTDGAGTVFVVNKALNPGDEKGDFVRRIRPAK